MLLPISDLVSFGVGIGSAIIGKEKSMNLLRSVEEALQEEQDEMLRILNENNVD